MKTTRGGWVATGTSARRRARTETMPGAKATRTRAHLLDAARRVFACHGYADATVDHIVVEAGMSRGSFYTYFESKADIVVELVSLIDDQVARAVVTFDRPAVRDPLTNLAASNRNYLEVVDANADLYRLVEQVAAHNTTVYDARLQSRRQHVTRVAASIRRWQRRGWADPGVDPEPTAAALVAMLSGSAQWLHVRGDERDHEVMLDTLNTIWIRACGLRTPEGSA